MFRKRIILCLCAAMLCLPMFALAVTTPPTTAQPTIGAGNTGLDAAADGTGLKVSCKGEACLVNIAVAVINIMFTIVGILLLLLFIYAGFLWMTAQGDTDQIKKAKQTIINAAFGLIIMVAAYSASRFVMDQLGYALTGKFPAPQEQGQPMSPDDRAKCLQDNEPEYCQ